MNHDDAYEVAKDVYCEMREQALEEACRTYHRILSQIATPQPDPDPVVVAPTEGKRFFHIMDHNNQPDLHEMFGLEPLKIYYEGAFFDSSRARTDAGYSIQNANLTKTANVARSAPLVSCVDIERWAHKDTWQVPDQNIIRYLETLGVYEGNLPTTDHKFGLYSILPVRNYFNAVGEKSKSQWQGWNDQVARLASMIDMTFPSLYTFSSVFLGDKDRLDMWEDYAVANIEEARRIAPGKPVYPFLWPWYHPGAKTPIDSAFWRFQLEICAQHADGFVIWDDLSATKTEYSKLPDWWDETIAFMKTV